MRSGFLDTLTRIVMMVLAGMVSLSLIGGIAAMSEGGGPGGFVVEAPRPAAPPPVPQEPEQARPAGEQQPGGLRRADPAGEGAASVAAAAGAPADESARWLEAIAYILFALAGLAALLALILWRIFGELRRAADAAERLAERSAAR